MPTRKKRKSKSNIALLTLPRLTIIGLGIAALLLLLLPAKPLTEAETKSFNFYPPVEIDFSGIAREENIASETIDTEAQLAAEFTAKQTEIEQFYRNIEKNIAKHEEFKRKVSKLVSFLRRQGSPIATEQYARQIISLSETAGADYRIIVAIMGIESGFCAANYKKYNCFGYLNKVQYGSFNEAFTILIPKISRQYARPYGTNFAALAKAYGMLNVESAVSKFKAFYSALS